MKPAIERIDVSRDELNQLLERAKTALHEDDYRKLKATVDALSYLTELVADRETTIRDLRQLLLPPNMPLSPSAGTYFTTIVFPPTSTW